MANNYEQVVMFSMMNVERLEAQNVRQPFGVKVNLFLALSDITFVKTYRLSKNLTNYLIELVTPFIEPPKRSSAFSVQDKVPNKVIKKIIIYIIIYIISIYTFLNITLKCSLSLNHIAIFWNWVISITYW
jgi:hypothetical protein